MKSSASKQRGANKQTDEEVDEEMVGSSNAERGDLRIRLQSFLSLLEAGEDGDKIECMADCLFAASTEPSETHQILGLATASPAAKLGHCLGLLEEARSFAPKEHSQDFLQAVPGASALSDNEMTAARGYLRGLWCISEQCCL